MNRVLAMTVVFGCAMVLCTACSTTDVAKNFNGLSTPAGKPIGHLNTSTLALNLLITQPLIGDASLEGTVSDFTQAAKNQNASKVNIVQSKSYAWWWIFPPFSFILTPVSGNVAGDALP